jgi:hypothetical protein
MYGSHLDTIRYYASQNILYSIRLIHIGLQRFLTKPIADKPIGPSSYTYRGLILVPFAHIISNGPKSIGPKPIGVVDIHLQVDKCMEGTG